MGHECIFECICEERGFIMEDRDVRDVVIDFRYYNL